jgi:histidinol phosphatase-like enzyme
MENKKSKLCFDAKIVRKLLKMNDEVKFCPYCGKEMTEKCDCHKNMIIDIKPYRGESGVLDPDRSVFVFDNNEAFQNDLTQLIDEAKAKKEAEPEQLVMDLD